MALPTSSAVLPNDLTTRRNRIWIRIRMQSVPHRALVATVEAKQGKAVVICRKGAVVNICSTTHLIQTTLPALVSLAITMSWAPLDVRVVDPTVTVPLT